MALRTLRQRICFSFLLLLVFACLAYLGTIVKRTRPAYALQTSGRGWAGKMHEPDPELGFRMIPGARGAETFPIAPDVAACVDREGFRVPADAPEPSPRTRPLVLALGCSYTYGAACAAEDTFAYRVATRLHGSCVNAGVCSYGLAQMLILARKLIPLLEPDYVLFQHSPWLVSRSQSRYAGTYFGLVPTPTFIEEDGASRLRPPLFQSLVFDLPLERYSHAEQGFLGFLSFQWRVGLPLFLHDDAHKIGLALSMASDTPTPNAALAERVHAEVAALSAQHRSRLVYVLIGYGCPPVPVPDDIQKSGCAVAYASVALCASIPDIEGKKYAEQFRAYMARYAHWAGDPPEMIDPHPNREAHAVIADTILTAIGADK
jgi:hypothetical protein